MGVNHQIERGWTAAQSLQRAGQIRVQHGGGQGADGRRGKTDRRRIRRIRLQQQIRPFAPQQLAGEVHRHGHGELHIALRKQLADFPRAAGHADDIEIAAVAERPDKRARKGAVVRGVNRRGQMFRI